MPEVRRTHFATRTYQRALRRARQSGCRRFLCLWHRRSGKDRNGAHFILEEALPRPAVYYHIFPSLVQGRRDFWDARIEDPRGSGHFFNMIECFPPEFVVGRDDREMQVALRGGALYQIMGADDIHAVNRMRGSNPYGLLFSEYAHGPLMKNAWEVLSPVLAENGGWALFAYTPNGENHGKRLWDMASNNPFHPRDNALGWFTQKLTVDDTRRDAHGEDGSPVVTPEMIAAERKEGKRESWIRQEYFCDFTGASEDSIYGDLMQLADREGRIRDIPYIANAPVGVLLDLGKSDAMVLWFYQVIGQAINFIDYIEDERKDMRWAAKIMRERPYIYGRIVLPWDSRGGEEYLSELGFRNVVVNERTPSVSASIDQARRMFPRFYFDRTKCARGIAALQYYRRERDEDRDTFKERPLHDWSSHGADALRAGVEGGFEPLLFPNQSFEPLRVETDFDPRFPTVGGGVFR